MSDKKSPLLLWHDLQVFPGTYGDAVLSEVDLIGINSATPDLIGDSTHRTFGDHGSFERRLELMEQPDLILLTHNRLY